MYLVVIEDDRGGLVSETQLDEGRLAIGRTPENDIVLVGNSISRQHCEVVVRNQSLVIVDKNSSNGVYVNDIRVSGSQNITEGSLVGLGDYRLRIERLTPKGGIGGISTALVSPDQAHARLILLTGRQTGREVLLFEPITSIGRIDENDVSIPDISVSRHHAQLRLQPDGSYVLIDLNSSNGTYHKGHQIHQPTLVNPGDKVGFGSIECVIIKSKDQGPSELNREKWLIYGGLGLVAALLGIMIGRLLTLSGN